MLELRVVHPDRVVRAAGRNDGCMFVDAQRAEIPRFALPVEAKERFLHAYVPETDPTVGFGGDEFAEAAALEVHADDPGFVVGFAVSPGFDHGFLDGHAEVVGAETAVTEAGHEDIAFDLVGGKRGDAGRGAGG